MLKNIEYKDVLIHLINNANPIINETSCYSNKSVELLEEDNLVLDDLYGRIFTKNVYESETHPYGETILMPNYVDGLAPGYETYISDYLRVPYRKVPIYSVSNNREAKKIIEFIKRKSSDKEVLFRGQEKLYYIDRPDDEKYHLYGDKNIKEPSFLASFSREKLDEDFTRCFWNWQGRVILNDVGIDLKKIIAAQEYEEFKASKLAIEGTNRITYFSLGMAQHYGLPSIGLDFTDNYETALFFASTHYDKDKNDNLKVTPVKDFDNSMIYVFSCPKSIVFNYKTVKPKHFPNGRPDCQNAWFGYGGWGEAKNQMALYLSCCIKVSSEMAADLPEDYYKSMFPNASDDLILDNMLKIKDISYFEQEVKDILSRVYEVYA